MSKKFVIDFKYGDELVKLGFNPLRYTNEKQCKSWYEYCKKYNMKYCVGSYGLLCHKDFLKFFDFLSDIDFDLYNKIMNNELPNIFSTKTLDHVEIFCLKDNSDVHFIITSPYLRYEQGMFHWKGDDIGVYVVHPGLLEYTGFLPRRDFGDKYHYPLDDLTYMITSKENEKILNDVFASICPYFMFNQIE